MATDIKKFLDQQGVSTLWSEVVKKVDASVKAEETRALAAEKANADAIAALDTKVGVVPEGSADVIAYVDKKTTGIASDEALGKLAERVTTAEGAIDAIEADYLTSVDKAAVEKAISDEASRADAAEKANAAAIKAVADDYLKAADKTALEGQISDVDDKVDGVIADYLKTADKTELSNAIALKADQTALDGVKATAEAAATKAEFDAAVEALEAEDERIAGLVATEQERAEGIEADHKARIEKMEAFFKGAAEDEGEGESLQNALDTLVEIQTYVDTHGEVADQMIKDIAANKKSIEDHVATNHDFASADAALKSELEGKINLKADQTTVDGINGRLETAEGEIDALQALFGSGDGTVADMIADAVAGEAALREEAIAGVNAELATKATIEALNGVKATADAAAVKTDVEAALALKADTSYVNGQLDLKADKTALAEVKATADAAAAKTYVDEELAKKADKTALAQEVADRQAAVKVNTDAIAAIKDHATVDSFADVMAEIAKKQDTIPANTYDIHGAAAQALTDAKAYTDTEFGKIQSLTKNDILQAIADAEAEAEA